MDRDNTIEREAGNSRHIASFSSQEGPFSMLIHFSTLLSLFFPGIGLIVSCILWLYKREESDFIYECGRHALNFQLSSYLYIFFCLIVVATAFSVKSSHLLYFILGSISAIFSIYLYWLIFTFIAGFKVARGKIYRIPFTLPLIKAKKDK